MGIVSKNNAEDAEEGFSHPDSVLQWEDFAIKRANWDPKSRNIVEMAKELNIGLDSIVFVDDNPIERAEVKSSLPEVEVPEFPEDTCQLACFGEDLYRRFFLKWDLSDEDKQKTEMYLENKAREESKTQFFSMEQYLSSLNMELFMEEAREEHLPRIQQMVLKTNQFNMTTRRYGEETLRGMIQSEKAHVLIGRMKDRFGDNGICVLLIVLIEGSQAHIDTFLMSCRVMGRTVEHAAVLWMEAFLRKKNVKTLTAEMIPTKKNMPARAFYKEMGYMQTSDSSETEKYRSSLEREKKVPCYVKIC